MSQDGPFDFIIIGSGAGGGTLALKLAGSGKRILILERGDYLPREKENWDPTEVFVKNRYVAGDKWRDKAGKEFQPGIHYVVGGATKVFGAALFRLRKEDFGAVQHHDGVSRPGPSPTRNSSPITARRKSSTRCMGCGGRTPPSRRRACPIRFHRSPTNLASSGSMTICSGRATILFTPRPRSC